MGHATRSDHRADAASGDFEAFFRAHYRTVVRLAYSVLGDFQRSQDVAQEVFLAAHRRFGQDADPPVGWVKVAAVHTALNTLRGERRRDQHQRRLEVLAAHPSPEEAVIERESRAEVRQALERLRHRSAAVLVMRHGGMTYAEMATALGVNVGQVGTMLRRAESALIKELDRAARH